MLSYGPVYGARTTILTGGGGLNFVYLHISFQLINNFNKTEAAVFLIQAMLPEGFPSYQCISNFKGNYNNGKTQIDPHCFVFICLIVQANKSTKSYNCLNIKFSKSKKTELWRQRV